jgi:hypothetical protein
MDRPGRTSSNAAKPGGVAWNLARASARRIPPVRRGHRGPQTNRRTEDLSPAPVRLRARREVD